MRGMRPGLIAHGIFATAGALTAFAAALTPAHAAIKCFDGYQKVQGNLLATPYCQDDLLATVARQYGMKASAAAIRDNPNYKREICRLVGRDIRISDTCNSVNPNGRFRTH